MNTERLPTIDQGLDGILAMADTYGDAETYTFIGYLLGKRSPLIAARQEIIGYVFDEFRNEHPHLSDEEARRALADSFGFTDTKRTNFYKRYLDPAVRRQFTNWNSVSAPAGLPTADDGIEGLIGLAKQYDTRDVFDFLGYMHDERMIGVLGNARRILAARMVLDYQSNNRRLSYEESRREVGLQLGYEGGEVKTLSNFYKLADAGVTLLAERGELASSGA